MSTYGGIVFDQVHLPSWSSPRYERLENANEALAGGARAAENQNDGDIARNALSFENRELVSEAVRDLLSPHATLSLPPYHGDRASLMNFFTGPLIAVLPRVLAELSASYLVAGRVFVGDSLLILSLSAKWEQGTVTFTSENEVPLTCAASHWRAPYDLFIV